MCSPSNLDLLRHEEVDVAVCLNPMSTTARVGRSLNPVAQVPGAMRAAAGRRLAGEVRKLEALGVPVVAIEPGAADLVAMGHNLMARGRRAAVTEQAYRSVARSPRRRTLPDLGAGPGTPRASLRRAA